MLGLAGSEVPHTYQDWLAPGRIVVAVDVSAPMIEPGEARIPGAMEALVGASQILTRTLVQRLIEQEPPDVLIRAGADRIGGLDFFKAKAILAAEGVQVLCATYMEDRAEFMRHGFPTINDDDWLSIPIRS